MADRAARLALALALVALAGCPSFHAARPTGAPSHATFVDVDGVHVHYRDVGGTAPAVVFLHGFGASSAAWLGVMQHAATSYRGIAIDLKGFGFTSRPEGDYSPAAQAKLVWGVLDKLGVKDVAIVGHSWGSSVAFAMAIEQPARTRRVAVYDAYVYDDQIPSFFRWAQKSGIGEVLFGLYYKERIEDRAPLAYRDHHWVTQARIDAVEADLDRPGTVAAALAAVRGQDFSLLVDRMRRTKKPVLLLWGENDEVTPLPFGHRLAKDLLDAELRVYPSCGHIPMVEAEYPSTRDLLAFLAKDLAEITPAPKPAPITPPPDDVAPTSTTGGGGGGGGGGGSEAAIAANAELIASNATSTVQIVRPTLPDLSTLTAGADLGSLGTELTPRLYAAPRFDPKLAMHGYLRFREQGLFNLDLDRGLDARGQPVFPVPLGGGQKLEAGDLRARTDLAIYAAGVGVAIKARIDWLDNVGLGGDPDLSNGAPATSPGQRPTTVVVKRAWAEALTPIGILAAGRMGAHFGLGIAANGGNCDDCDKGDAADRLAFVTPIAGHLIGVAWDVAARGPFTQSRDGGHPIVLEPNDSASGVTLAVLKVSSPATIQRRARADRTSLEYGAYVAVRAQETDVPASYLPTASPPMTFTANDLVARGFSALTTGAWLRIYTKSFRLEGELAYARADLDQPSLIPGAEIMVPVTSRQLGAAMQSEVLVTGTSRVGFDAGYASGDDAPGFGAFPKLGEAAPPRGSFDGPQANLPLDSTVDNFRFHPDYRIDQILFREIIGTITDAFYLRPHARARLLTIGDGRLEAIAAVIASWAVQPDSTPSGQKHLGIELDPELRYTHADGFAGALTYGVFVPGPAFDAPSAPTPLQAQAAHVVRARLWFVF